MILMHVPDPAPVVTHVASACFHLHQRGDAVDMAGLLHVLHNGSVPHSAAVALLGAYAPLGPGGQLAKVRPQRSSEDLLLIFQDFSRSFKSQVTQVQAARCSLWDSLVPPLGCVRKTAPRPKVNVSKLFQTENLFPRAWLPMTCGTSIEREFKELWPGRAPRSGCESAETLPAKKSCTCSHPFQCLSQASVHPCHGCQALTSQATLPGQTCVLHASVLQMWQSCDLSAQATACASRSIPSQGLGKTYT